MWELPQINAPGIPVIKMEFFSWADDGFMEEQIWIRMYKLIDA